MFTTRPTVLAVLFALTSAPFALAAEEKVTIGTGGTVGVYSVAGQVLCEVWQGAALDSDASATTCETRKTSGSLANLELLRSGEIELGFVQSDWQYHAANGTNRFEDNAIEDLRVLFSFHPEPFHILVGAATKIETWDQLKGKRVSIGEQGSGQRATFDVLLEAHGLDKSYFSEAVELPVADQSQKLCKGEIDAYGYIVGVPNAGVSEAADGCGAKILSLNSDTVLFMVEENPFYAVLEIPTGTYTTTVEPVETFGVMATVVARETLSDDAAYELTKAVFENLEDIRRRHPAFSYLNSKAMVTKGISARFHPGAMRYFEEVGLFE